MGQLMVAVGRLVDLSMEDFQEAGESGSSGVYWHLEGVDSQVVSQQRGDC